MNSQLNVWHSSHYLSQRTGKMAHPKGEALGRQWEEAKLQKVPVGGKQLCCLPLEQSAPWCLRTGHGYIPQIWTLTLLLPGFRIKILYSTCWFQAVAPRGVCMSRSSIISVRVSVLAPSRSVSLDSTSLQDPSILDSCFVHL